MELPFTISGTGKQVRDVLHSEDLIRLYRLSYERRERISGEILNIRGGLDNRLSLLELFNPLEKKLELDSPLLFHKQRRRQSDQDNFVANVTKARKLLSWEPSVSTDEGLDRMIDWVVKQA